MGMGAEDDELHRSSAEPFFTLFPIHPTTAGTKLAVLENVIGLFDSLSEFTLFLKLLIGWDPWFFFFR